MVSSSRLGMPPSSGTAGTALWAAQPFPPSEGNKLNNVQFTACLQVSSERGRRGKKENPGASRSGCKSVCLGQLTPAVALAPRFCVRIILGLILQECRVGQMC